ncbi:cysteine desulfurase [Elysia marginata]|uniref:cysteine desulfurase n=1 Tax=Elysia marginata TaxID=1093978 RepID=A0AAV4FW11_9GAST|nr:cysteine desulfurase [Elysia marginata]
MSFDVEKVRSDFPILKREVNGNPLVYLDNAATTQKPKQVVDEIVTYYNTYNANIHRGVHTLSQEATKAFEKSRETIQHYINAKYSSEVIFTAGTTFGINMVAYGLSGILKAGDEVVISSAEHHSNIVPWQVICKARGAKLKTIPLDDKGDLDIEGFRVLLNNRVKLVAFNHVSNSLGTINPIKEMIYLAHQNDSIVLVDGAQGVSHIPIDVQDLDIDFYVFSGHKIYAPTGIGILYGKEHLLENMPPYQGGGEMIKEVTFEKTTYADLPHKFEAGTPNIVGGIALGRAIDYLNDLGLENVNKYERDILKEATRCLLQIEGLKIYGSSNKKVPVISFNVEMIHPYDIGSILDQMGIAVRTGHHCTQPVMDRYKIPGTVRASFAFYNTLQEIDILVKSLEKAVKMLKV